MSWLVTVFAIQVLPLVSHDASAQDKYPSKPIRLVIPFAPAGSTDIVGRKLGEKMGSFLGTAFIIDNKAGAGGTIGAAEVAKARPDGYTLLFSASSTQVIAPLMMLPNPPYDGLKDFATISLIGLQHMSVVAGPGMPAQNLRDMLALLRANSGKYSYASAGIGSINHLTGEIFNRQANVKVTHVPYKGTGPAMNDLMGGHIALMMATTASVLDQVRTGKIRMLATFSDARLAATPDVPTAIEAGVPDMAVSTFSGLFAPSAITRPLIAQIHQASARVLKDAEFQKNLESLGVEPVTDSTPESATRFVSESFNRLAPVIKALGIKLEQ